ncbi:MAG TPA: c-type cytochrome [Kofleriaceae bacterium]|jgi:mono/diheme cytochrome c family protein|nr:c-type cytochrome [Kofleriaceae bacterium]
MGEPYHGVARGCRQWHLDWVKSWLLAVTASLLGGCGRAPSSGGVAATNGQAVFASMCATCHGPDGRPPASMVARLGVRDLTAAEFRARVTPALVEQQVRVGSKNKLMPSFAGVLEDAQVTAVAAYVASPQFVARP